jgi:hypothetical protein
MVHSMVGPPAHFADHAGRLAFRHGPGHAAVEFRDRSAFLEGFLLAVSQGA